MAVKLAKVWGLTAEDFSIFGVIIATEEEEKPAIGFIGGDVISTAEDYYEEME